MGKYNLTPVKEKPAAYRNRLKPEMVDELEKKIFEIIVIQKKYMDPDFSAAELAKMLGTNTRYISAVVGLRFGKNYTGFVNEYRIKDALGKLLDKRYASANVEEIGKMVGFANRQSFYTSFYKITGQTPRGYRVKHS